MPPALLHEAVAARARIEGRDWSGTPLGPMDAWPGALRTLAALLLDMPSPAALLWGATCLHNDAFQALLAAATDAIGCGLDEAWPQHWPDLQPLVESAQHGQAAQATILMDQTHLDFTATPVRDEAGRVLGVFLTVSDTSRALRASEERLRRVQRIGRVGGFEIDLRTGVNLRSAEYMAVQGRARTQAEEQHADWVRRLHPEDRERAERRFLDAIADHAPQQDYAQEYRIVTPEGGVRWIAARAEIERDAAGLGLRMLGAHMDITELKLAEAALAESMQRSREVLESLGDMLYALDAEGRIRFASARALAAWGKRADEVMGRHFLDCFGDARDSTSWQVIQDAARMRREVHLCAVSPLFGRWFELDIHPAAGGGVTVAARDVHEARAGEIARRRTEAALRTSEARLRLAQEAGEVGTWEWDVVTGTLHWSESCHRLHGTDPAQPADFERWMDGVHAEDRPGLQASLEAAMAGDVTRWHTEIRFRRVSDGALRWIAGRGEVVRDARRRAIRLHGIALDVTERHESDERQGLLMRELDHRAKNALAVVQAAVRMTPKHDPEAFATAVLGRIGALARAHTLLAQGRWEGVALHSLAEGELAPFVPGGAAGRVRTEGPPVMLPPTSAQAVSMALHELATNATKHGALSVPGGAVRVSWCREDAANALRLRWEETGGPGIAAPPTRRGFGSRVLEATVAGQLGGRLALLWRPGGLVCEIDIPLSRTFVEATTPEVTESG